MTAENIFLALETIMLSLCLVSLPRINIGNIAGILLTALLFLVTAFYKDIILISHYLWQSFYGKVIVSAVLFIAVFAVVYAVLLTVLMIKAMNSYPKRENVLVVLGCRVKGTKPTRMLRRRLDTAYNYMKKNPNVLCILSGGQGSDEKISEAEAMLNYLLSKGISADRLIKEDKSTSTLENISYSMGILNDLGLPSEITIVTDGFHQYRAQLIARSLNIRAAAVPAHTEPRYVFIYWVREWLALTRHFVNKYKKGGR